MRVPHCVPLEDGGIRYHGPVVSRMAWRRGRWVRVWYSCLAAALEDETARDAVRDDELVSLDGSGPPPRRRWRVGAR